MGEIPVIDCCNDIQGNSLQILKAIETVGFVYLKNIGITPEKVKNLINTSDKFWNLPLETKMKYSRSRTEREPYTSYVPPGMQIFDTKNSAEFREAYDVSPGDGDTMILPDDILPEFRRDILEFFELCKKSAYELMSSLAASLKLPDAELFDKSHKYIGQPGNATDLRLLNYPPLPQNIPPKSSRCGEHSDWGTITLLFQDEVGGLEVRRRDGTFIPATPEPDAVLLNTGDLLQRWTADRLIAVRHRVLVPENKSLYSSCRRSVAFFVQPDDDFLVAPLDGSEKYEPITAKQYLMNKMTETFLST